LPLGFFPPDTKRKPRIKSFLLLGIAKYQMPERLRHMKIRGWCECRAPRRIKSRLRFPFDSKEISPPAPLWIERRRKAPHRYSKFRRPRLRRLIPHHAPPQSAAHLFFLPVRNVQIDPISIRANFQFFIHALVTRVRLQKRFRHVALPQFVPPPVRPRIRKHMQLPVARQKPQEQRLLIPQQPHFRGSLRILLLASPNTIKSNRWSPLPPYRLRKSLRPHASFEEQGVSDRQTTVVQNRSTIHRPDIVVHQPPAILLVPTPGQNRALRLRPVS
jgi:hypothetical protein